MATRVRTADAARWRRRLSPILRLEEFVSVRSRRADLPRLQGLLAIGPETHLLDIGGGTGGLAAPFAREGARVIVLEPNPRKVAYGRDRHEHVEFVEGRGEKIPFPDQSFDRAIAMFSFHHVEDPDAVLEEVRRVVRPSGRFLLQEFHPSAAPGRLARLLAGRNHAGVHTFFAPEELRATLEAHGFRDVSIHAAKRGYFIVAVR